MFALNSSCRVAAISIMYLRSNSHMAKKHAKKHEITEQQRCYVVILKLTMRDDHCCCTSVPQYTQAHAHAHILARSVNQSSFSVHFFLN